MDLNSKVGFSFSNILSVIPHYNSYKSNILDLCHMGIVESLGEFYATFGLFLWILGIVIPSIFQLLFQKLEEKLKNYFLDYC